MRFRYEYTIRKNKDTEEKEVIRDIINLTFSRIFEDQGRKSYFKPNIAILDIQNAIATKYYKEQWREPCLKRFEDLRFEFHREFFGDNGQYSILDPKTFEENIFFSKDVIKEMMEHKAKTMKEYGFDKILS